MKNMNDYVERKVDQDLDRKIQVEIERRKTENDALKKILSSLEKKEENKSNPKLRIKSFLKSSIFQK